MAAIPGVGEVGRTRQVRAVPARGDGAVALWLGPTERPLFAWLDVPEDGAAAGVAVVCPAMGLESAYSSRALRDLAHRLTASGWAALRIDYAATGDSAGTWTDPDLVTEWLNLERKRVEFYLARTELDVSRSIAGLTLDFRLDRIDRLIDGSLLVIDYKSGNASPKLWEMPRPDDVQLPLYAGFGLDAELRAAIACEFGDAEGPEDSDAPAAPLGGLVFAKVRAGELCFAGRVGDARATLLPVLAAGSALVKKRFSAEELMDWRDYIEQMARDFLDGWAEVDPRDYPKTCERCDLQALCRVRENREEAEDDEEGDGDE